jgi:hypothetical protein
MHPRQNNIAARIVAIGLYTEVIKFFTLCAPLGRQGIYTKRVMSLTCAHIGLLSLSDASAFCAEHAIPPISVEEGELRTCNKRLFIS